MFVLMLVSVACAIAGFKAFGNRVNDKVNEQAGSVSGINGAAQ